MRLLVDAHCPAPSWARGVTKFRDARVTVTRSDDGLYSATYDGRHGTHWRTIKEACQAVLTRAAGVQMNVTTIRNAR